VEIKEWKRVIPPVQMRGVDVDLEHVLITMYKLKQT
jgi:hypothetical protein